MVGLPPERLGFENALETGDVVFVTIPAGPRARYFAGQKTPVFVEHHGATAKKSG